MAYNIRLNKRKLYFYPDSSIVYVDGKLFTVNPASILTSEGTTYVPLRAFFEKALNITEIEMTATGSIELN